MAIFEIGMSEFDATFVFMPLAEAQAYFNRDGDVSVIEVYRRRSRPDRRVPRDAIQAACRAPDHA